MNNSQFIPCVNYHLTCSCNMKCKYCFAHYERDSQCHANDLSRSEQLNLIKFLRWFGFTKISFAGGEPTLCKNLPFLIQYAKEIGFTTMLVTNGSGINKSFLDAISGNIDWICISIDSLHPSTNKAIGRSLPGNVTPSKKFYNNIISLIKSENVRLKINTVLSKFNINENFREFISFANPERWKIFQVLPITGQNLSLFKNYEISSYEMDGFLLRHSSVANSTNIVPEKNSDMKGSYVMVSPSGRFYCNSNGRHVYSDPILEKGVDFTLSQMQYSIEKFIMRKGLYDW